MRRVFKAFVLFYVYALLYNVVLLHSCILYRKTNVVLLLNKDTDRPYNCQK